MLIIGIDPGKHGGWALYSDNLETKVVVGIMPLEGDIINVRYLVDIINKNTPSFTNVEPKIFIESVSAMPKQGVCSMFTFGKGFGQLIGMCQALQWSYELVRPQTWKNIVLKDTAKDKNAAIAIASRLFPKVPLVPQGCRKPHDGIADALCMVSYGMMKERGEICLEKQKHKSQK